MKIAKYLVAIAWMLLLSLGANAQNGRRNFAPQDNVPLDSIQLSDPFVFAHAKSQTYYMTGTGGMVWKSKDLATWSGPYRVIEVNPDSWMGPHPMVWAAEIHEYNGKYY